MVEQPEITQFVTAVFRAWQRAGIRFLVLRNYEQLPQFTTNDIDVLVDAGQVARAERELVEAARECGFRLHNRAEFATLALYFSTPSGVQTHFDLFTSLKWRGFDFLDCQAFLDRRQDRGLFAIPHTADEAATNLMASFLFTGKVKEKYRPAIQAGFQQERELATKLLARSYGAAHAEFLLTAGAEGRWAEIEARVGALRRTLIWRQVTRRLGATIGSQCRDLGRFLRRGLRPPGLMVVLCGADGCGKSTAARAVIEGLAPTFSSLKGTQFHWKPPVFSGRRRAARAPTTDPHCQPVRSTLASLAYFSVHWLEFFLGAFVVIWPVTFRGGLVLVDRYYYDFFVDPKRYRLRLTPAVVRLGYRLLRKPDLVVLLDAPTEVLRRRKREVPPEETERQRQAYRELIENLDYGLVIDASQSAARVAGAVQRAVLDRLARRTQRRLGSHADAPSAKTKRGEARG